MARRVSVDEARRQVDSGKALLVCAYGDEQKCRGLGVDGSITYNEFEGRLPALSRNQQIIFF